MQDTPSLIAEKEYNQFNPNYNKTAPPAEAMEVEKEPKQKSKQKAKKSKGNKTRGSKQKEEEKEHNEETEEQSGGKQPQSSIQTLFPMKKVYPLPIDRDEFWEETPLFIACVNTGEDASLQVSIKLCSGSD